MALVGCGSNGDTPADAAIDATPICTHVPNLRVLGGMVETFGTAAGRRFEGMICVDVTQKTAA